MLDPFDVLDQLRDLAQNYPALDLDAEIEFNKSPDEVVINVQSDSLSQHIQFEIFLSKEDVELALADIDKTMLGWDRAWGKVKGLIAKLESKLPITWYTNRYEEELVFHITHEDGGFTVEGVYEMDNTWSIYVNREYEDDDEYGTGAYAFVKRFLQIASKQT